MLDLAMNARNYIDFSRIETDQDAIHLRLVNWARYVRDHPNMWPVQPMFRQAKTPRQWDISPHIRIEVDQLDGLLVEKTVRHLPEKNRDAVRWFYAYSAVPVGKMARHLGLSPAGLDVAVRDGRTMLINRLRRE